MADERTDQDFRHVALLYRGVDEFVELTVPFLRQGLGAGAAVMVATSAEKCGRLSDALGERAGGVEFHDMAEVGRNPATILPMWLDFAGRHPGRPLRGIGEPIWAGRTDAELVECVHHESLLNLAFEDEPDVTLVCPYDEGTLPAEVIAEAHRTHPILEAAGDEWASSDYAPPGSARGPFEGGLKLPPPDAAGFDYAHEDLPRVRRRVADRAVAAGLSSERAMDLALAVHELATNSVQHGGGSGRLTWWEEDGSLVCEVRDAGRISEPMLGRVRPPVGAAGGRGLWLVNQLCDLVQIRSGGDSNRVRVRVGPR